MRVVKSSIGTLTGWSLFPFGISLSSTRSLKQLRTSGGSSLHSFEKLLYHSSYLLRAGSEFLQTKIVLSSALINNPDELKLDDPIITADISVP